LREFSSENTKKAYRHAMKKFASYIGVENKDMDSFVKNYLDQLEDEEEFIDDIKGFISYMNNDLAPKTINLYLSSVKEFFEEKTEYKIEEAEWKAIRRRQVPTAKAVSKDKILNQKELRQVVSHLDSMGTSLILFLISSGARPKEAVSLKVEDLDLEADPPRAELNREITKNGVGRVVFMTDEARDSIKDWLRIRKGMSKATPKDKRDEEDSNSYDTKEVWNCTTNLVRKKWNTALKKAGLDETDKRTNVERHVYHLYSLRRYFRTNMNSERDIIETLLGHEGYLDSSYRRYRDEELAEEYKTAENSLKIYEAEKSKRERIKTSLAYQGISEEETANILNELGYENTETGGSYTASNLATEDIDTIRERMKEVNAYMRSEEFNREMKGRAEDKGLTRDVREEIVRAEDKEGKTDLIELFEEGKISKNELIKLLEHLKGNIKSSEEEDVIDTGRVEV